MLNILLIISSFFIMLLMLISYSTSYLSNSLTH